MAGVRIKDLQDAKSVIDKFDEMQFAVDSGNPDTTLRLSGKDLKQVIGTPRHTHPIEVGGPYKYIRVSYKIRLVH